MDQPAEISLLERLSNRTTVWAGSSTAFIAVMLLVMIWLALGPFTHFSDAWQLVMNTISSIVTFIMVFLIQRAQNKESLAVHVKLNELIAAKDGARNALINAEDLSEAELRRFHAHFSQLIGQLPKKPEASGSGPV